MAQSGTTTEDHCRNTKNRQWFFTLNNPIDDDLERIFDLDCEEFLFQLEEGESGTPHLQGLIRFVNARYFNSLREYFMNRIHLEPCRRIHAARLYVTKTETKVAGPWERGCPHVLTREEKQKKELKKMKQEDWDYPRDPMEGLELRDWEIQVLAIMEDDPDERTINWIYDPIGNCGKTCFCKHLCITREDCHYISGRDTDCRYAIAQMAKPPRVILWDLPRQLEGCISYAGMESVKNGIFLSGKYESCEVIFDSPHIFVFANWLPDMSALSADRWNIIRIAHEE